MFGAYVQVLLHLPPSGNRDRLLTRAFGLLDLMLVSVVENVRNLGFIGMVEGREAWWLKQSEPFLGPAAQRELDRWRAGWRAQITAPHLEPDREIIDIYDVRSVVAKELQCDVADVPGQTYFTPDEPAT